MATTTPAELVKAVVESGVTDQEVGWTVLRALKAQTDGEIQLSWPKNGLLATLARGLGSVTTVGGQWLFNIAEPGIHHGFEPLKALFEGVCPPSELSKEILLEVIRLVENPGTSACQIAAPCHLLAGFTGPALVRFAEGKTLPSILSFDSMLMLETVDEQKISKADRSSLEQQLQKIFENIK